jgi:intergrase/recombinase
VFYPTRYIIAVFDTAAQAEQAVAAVKQVRCEARHATPQQVLERAHEFLRERSPVQRLEGVIASDEKDAMKEYISLAEQGHHFVDVYVPEESEVTQVESILEAHHAHAMHYYGEWELVDLSSNEPTR